MTKASATLIAVYRRDNLNKLAAFLADNAPEGARIVVPALAANRIEWPQSAAAALQIEKLAEPVLAMLANIAMADRRGRCRSAGLAPQPASARPSLP